MAKIAPMDDSEEPAAVFEAGEVPLSPSALRKQSSRVNINDTIFARIAYNPYFEMTTMGVIVCNAIWIGVDTNLNHESLKEDGKLPLEPVSIVVENIFCVYFTFEVFVRFFAYEVKRKCISDAWFVFDSILVACMIFETWIMVIVAAIVGGELQAIGPLAVLRLLRLLRLARMGRLLRAVPELAKLVKGIVKAARSVFFILLFLVLVMYVFSIIFTGSFSDREQYPLTPYCSNEIAQGLNESEGCLGDTEFGELGQDLCASMGDTFMTLFTRGVLGDNLDETVQAILDQSVMLMWVFLIFLIITFATLLNMLIGVICNVISEAASDEEEQEAANSLRDTIEEAFAQIDSDHNGLLSSQEWQQIKDDEKVREAFRNIGVEEERMEERLEQMHDMLFMDEDPDDEEFPDEDLQKSDSAQGYTVEELIAKVSTIRPDQNASALDLELMQAQIKKDQKLFAAKLKRMEAGVKKYIRLQAEEQAADAAKRQALAEEDRNAMALTDLPGFPNM